MTQGKIISFTYKGGRKVKGKINRADSKTIVVTLLTDYIGKNEEWYSGELKAFNIKEMKNIKVEPE